jgi:hypothetical protein
MKGNYNGQFCRKRTFHHFLQATMASEESIPHNDVIERMKARAGLMQ